MYNASIGQRSNETSGVAIDARKKEGDVATFHFADNTVRGVTQVGKVIVCAAPEVYDTARLINITTEEDQNQTVGINGTMVQDQERQFDLTKGSYDVRVVTGPSFTTQRQEAAQFYSQLIQAMPDLMPVIGDLVFKYQDTPGSQAISNRLRKLVDPKLLTPEEQEENQGDPQVMQLQQQLQQVTQQAQAQIAELQSQLKNKDADTMVKMADVKVKEQEVAVKGEEVKVKAADVKLKYLQTLQPQDAQAQDNTPEQQPQVDDSIEMLHAKIQNKQAEQQKQEQEAAMQQQMMLEMQQQEQQQAAMEAQMKIEQTQAVINALGGIQQQIAAQTQVTANLVQQVSQPLKVIRDAEGMIVGAE